MTTKKQTTKPRKNTSGSARGKTTQAAAQRLVCHKLHALRSLARRLGMLPLASVFERPSTPETVVAAVGRYGAAPLIVALAILASPQVSATQRAAASLMVEFYIPDWRDLAPPSLVGMVVDRNAPEVRAWRTAVLGRDGNRCARCGALDHLHAHHVVRWADAPDLRVEVSNGLTLCRTCHVLEHAHGG